MHGLRMSEGDLISPFALDAGHSNAPCIIAIGTPRAIGRKHRLRRRNQFGCFRTYLPTCRYIGRAVKIRPARRQDLPCCRAYRARGWHKMNGAVASPSVIRVTQATYIRGNNLICRIAFTQWPRVCTKEPESPESTEAGGYPGAIPATTTDNDPTTAHERRRLSRVYRRGNAIRAWIGPRYAGTVAVIIRQMEMLLN